MRRLPFEGRLLVCDMDGTLLNSSSKLSSGNIKALERFVDGGGMFTVATGRMEKSVLPYLDMLPVNVPAIVYNGAAIYDFKTDRVIWRKELDSAVAGPVRKAIDRFPEISVQVYHGGKTYFVAENKYSENHRIREQLEPVRTRLDEVPVPWLKIIIAWDPPKLKEVEEFLKGYEAEHSGAECYRDRGGELGSSKAGSSKAGSSKAGSSEAGSSEAGSSKAGSSEAGSSKAGGSKAGSSESEHSGTRPHEADSSDMHSCRPGNGEVRHNDMYDGNVNDNRVPGHSDMHYSNMHYCSVYDCNMNDNRVPFRQVYSEPQFLELLDPGATKGSALKVLIGMLGLERSRVISMGDNLNDIELIEEAGTGIAVGNAHSAVKAVADICCTDNNNDAVAEVIGWLENGRIPL